MRLFTVGPVEMFDEIKAVRGGGGKCPVLPYERIF